MTVTDMMCTQAGSGLLDALQPFVISSLHLSGRILGQGAYGVVLEAEIPGATCAVKKLHDVFQTGDAEWVDDQALEIYRTKFIRECKLLSSIRHPYIVQFLGVHFFPGSATPALVMEKLLTNLHGFLQPDTQHKPYIPVGLKISILHNVAQGLLFLQSHSPPIIHRDLSAKNVLLNIGMEAKIADLGVARLMPASKILMTKGPGNSIYLPPEAHGDAYDISIDLFSLGVLALFTFTLIFPDPLPATYTDVEGKVIGRTEIERRSVCMKELYEQLQNDHEIVSLIEKCLDNHPVQRPDIREIVQVLVTFKARCSDVHVAMNRLELLQVIERNGRETQDLTKQESQEREDTGNLGLDLSTGDSVSVKESETQLQVKITILILHYVSAVSVVLKYTTAVSTRVYVGVRVCTRVYDVCTRVYVCVCVCTRVYVCTGVYARVCVCTCVYDLDYNVELHSMSMVHT